MDSLIFGTYPLQGKFAYDAVTMALEVGYRHVDTAQWYENEKQVGRAVKDSASRANCLLTTKVHPHNCTPDRFIPSVLQSLQQLGTDRVHLLLLHWPPKSLSDFDAAIDSLNESVRLGYAANIGISNCTKALMTRAVARSSVTLRCNQVEVHPLIDQQVLEDCAKQLQMPLQAYCPLGRGAALGNPVIIEIARAHGATEAAIILRWLIQREITPVSMTTKRSNAIANLASLSINLSAADMASISGLRSAHRRLISIAEFAPEWD